jgi:hypothetical protein
MYRSNDRACGDRVVCFEHFDRPLIPLLALWHRRRPNVRFPIFAATDDVPATIRKSTADLAAVVLVPSKLHLQTLVLEVVQT